MTEHEEFFSSGQQKKTSKSKYRFRRICAVIILLAFVWWFNNYTLKITKISIESPKIKAPVRIAAISDLHASSHGISNKNIIKKIKKSDPDIVVMLGDMYTSGSSWDMIQIAVDLTEDIVNEGYPVYFVTGEHDTSEKYIEKIAESGAKVMNYRSDIINVNGNSLRIMGIDNVYYSSTFDLNNAFTIDDSCFNILLAHIPNYDDFAKFGADLTLCGDTHGGMVQLPFDLGPVYSSDYGKFFPQLTLKGTTVYDKGLFNYDGGAMFITSGIGDSPVPVRFNNRPEVAVIDIVPT